jgi:hypothetical protein
MKLNKKLFYTLTLGTFLSATFLIACKKDSATTSSSSGTQKLSVFLTDDPSIFDSVFIDIKYVEVKLDTSDAHKNDDHFGDYDIDHNNDHQGRDAFGKWDTLSVTPGVCNISQLRNGIDTLLGAANINGTIRKIRITLGDNNSLFFSGVSYPLNLIPGLNNYLYVKIDKEHHSDITSGQAALWIDFDISRSIVFFNGKYYLKPVLRPFCDNNFARVSGQVLPIAASPLVSVYNSTDTSNGIPRKDGDFKIRGLKAGSYSILYKGFNGYRDTTLLNVQLKKGEEKVLPVITLTK